MNTQQLTELTWPDVAQAVAAGVTTVILPLGATEQHGPHLPLGTDTCRAAALAGRLAERLPALVAPVIPIGCSSEHRGFAGLLSLEAETLAAVIVDCAQHMAGWGVQRLIVLTAHGGNGQALALAEARLHQVLPALAVWIPSPMAICGEAVLTIAAEAGLPFNTMGLHAGEWETSELLSLHPEQVRMEQAAPGHTGDMDAALATLIAKGTRALTAAGVIGDPCAADARRGERYLAAQAACYEAAWRQWLTQSSRT
ncbi:MAG TPA: mycofactocin biosynthesis peptidyl-dipeptidase MftE [Candidatus Competibacteraceae bacterium]|nr:mycofactocin biosynthesis peptidyl-dipeptidase MftE [Candidatus Competibacteraceae bacterium]MCP5134117.1 mycofactocin biosynthesis peptidyl-dipeptidase MftE [Gammaproteobacteria bacterium]HPF59940.1 mycofactocin biosynthesis peptidyl-dipeptidase MftE [Candidatus Competibacteraceae bacterium]HRY19124.1 mycofactocin biosynthesis peptidyl-dipeptidase MftE [Candidatus Competibacteraceae bacterium]